jgi:hypothetical protein
LDDDSDDESQAKDNEDEDEIENRNYHRNYAATKDFLATAFPARYATQKTSFRRSQRLQCPKMRQ